MSYAFELTCVLPATAADVYDAWLTSARHSAMTGGAANVSKRKGASYSAWDGYIVGRNVELVPFERIVQTWRTTEFPDDHPDSTIVVALTPVEGGTELKLAHSGVPDGQTSYENGGWQDYYFEPMRRYFVTKTMIGDRSRAAATKHD